MSIISALYAKRSFLIKAALFFVLISGYEMTQTEKLIAAEYVPVLVFGSKSSTGNGQLDNPLGIAVDNSSNIFVVDSRNNRVQKFNSSGVYQSQFGTYGSDNGQFYFPIGIAVDGSGNIFVVDSYNHRVQKFNSSGVYQSQFGTYGHGNGQFQYPQGVAVDGSGNIYVADTSNDRIQKFNKEGIYQSQFGSSGNGNGQFSYPRGISVDSSGNIFVVESGNNRVQKFDSTGVYQSQFGSYGYGNGQFDCPTAIALDSSGNIFVSDMQRVQKFNSIGTWQLGIYVADSVNRLWQRGVAVDSSGNIFVADWQNNRIQKFNSSGVYQSQFGSYVAGNGQFKYPNGVAVDSSGNIFVADSNNHRIQKFNKDGVYQSQFGSYGTGNGQFDYPYGLTVDSSGNIFVVDRGNHRIQKFNSSGVYQSQFGSYGTGNGQFSSPTGIAVDSSGNIFVADSSNDRVQKFNSAGVYQSQFGSSGSGDGQFDYLRGLAVDISENIFVLDASTSMSGIYHRIQKFDSTGVWQSKFINSLLAGNHPILILSYGIAVDSFGDIFVADTWNHRIQKWAIPKSVISGYIRDSSNNPGIGVTLTFSNGGGSAITDSSGFYTKTVSSDWSGTVTPSKGSYTFTPASRPYTTLTSDMPDQNYSFVASNKAIIVAGGGDYSTNGLWKATKTDTDYAYSVLTFQGYRPENIRYLSAQSSFISPVSGFASKMNLQNAITSWASDADNLLIYIADHGGNGTFRMNETEILSASELDTWLDTLQQTIPGYVIVIYDACQSGTFVSYLTPPTGKRRIIAASTSVGENAIFASEGTLSFGWLFWSQLYGGISFYQAFLNAQNSMSLVNPQNPVIEADGDGVPGGKGDSTIAATVRIGDEKAFGADFPLIGIVSPPQTLTAGTSATIFADQITDADGIKKVWAVITPPQNTGCLSADTPVTSLPTAELYKVSNTRYEGVYNGFLAKGTYTVAVFATDINDFTSLPAEKNITWVTQTQSFVKKGDISGDNQVNLTDVISALQVLSGLNPAQIRCDYSTSGADVNGDGRVGLQEVIYILQAVAGLRI